MRFQRVWPNRGCARVLDGLPHQAALANLTFSRFIFHLRVFQLSVFPLRFRCNWISDELQPARQTSIAGHCSDRKKVSFRLIRIHFTIDLSEQQKIKWGRALDGAGGCHHTSAHCAHHKSLNPRIFILYTLWHNDSNFNQATRKMHSNYITSEYAQINALPCNPQAFNLKIPFEFYIYVSWEWKIW